MEDHDDTATTQCISTLKLTRRFQEYLVSALEKDLDIQDDPRTELDSHADSPVVGRNVHILEDTGKTANVSGFTKDLGKCMSVPIVTAAVAYDNEYTGETSILIIHNALHMTSMEHNLIPPFVIRLAGAQVNEEPKCLAHTPTVDHHSISWSSNNYDSVDLRIPLQLHGTISYLPTRIPTTSEINDGLHYFLSPNRPDWDPHTEIYASQEHGMLDQYGEMRRQRQRLDNVLIGKVDVHAEEPTDGISTSRDIQISKVLTDISECLSHGSFATRLRGDDYRIKALSSSKRLGISAFDLAATWNISREIAKNTLDVTTQLCVRSSKNPSLARRYPTNDRMLRYNRLTTTLFMDTFLATSKKGFKSSRGNTCAQLFVTDFNYVRIEPMKARADCYKAVKSFFKHVGVPKAIVADGAMEQVYGETLKICNLVGCDIKELEKNTQWSNRAELYIGIMKKRILRALKNSNCPMKLWDYCATYMANVNNSIAHDHFQLQGTTPHTMMTGQPTDISSLCEFGWYEWVYFRENANLFPLPKEALGRCLGPAINAGNAMSQWVLNRNGTVLPKQTLRKLTPQELRDPEEIKKREEFTQAIQNKLGDSISLPDESLEEEEDAEPEASMPEADDIPDYDEYINAEVLLPNGEHMQTAKVVRRVRDELGVIKGQQNSNPILDTRVYEVMFPNGATQEYAANVIAENMYAQVDRDGHHTQLLKAIIDHRSDGKAVKKEDAFHGEKGNKMRRFTTKGWYFCVEWKDGTVSWKPLKDLKESNPIEIAEYVTQCGIADEPAFAWWVPFTLKKRERIISAVNNRVKKTTHKYGIRVPNTVEEAYRLDKENGNDLWRKAIAKEMKNVSIAFDIKEKGEQAPPGFIKSTIHMIFTVKMDFTRKARLVHDGHKVPPTETSAYAGVVSRESVRIALTYAALNELDVCAADIQNAYLQAPASEKYFIICGPEFGSENMGKIAIIKRALYGGPVSGANFRNHLRDCMEMLGYESCLADPDVWFRPASRSDGSNYYEYILLYVDDMLAISMNPKGCIEEIGEFFKMKPESVGPPDIYLGGKVSKVTLPNGVEAHAYSASQYVQNAVKNVEEYLEKKGMKLKLNAKAPLMRDYRPELDVSTELDHEEASYYQSLIGILRWAVELGRIDITAEVSMMSSALALPRQGHLQQVFHIFAYLKAKHNSRIVFDPTYPEIDYDKFKKRDWSTFYGKMKEIIPENAPAPRGKPFLMRVYVDADHAGDRLTRRSRTGYLILLNMSPIYWYSKKQTGIETSSFGSEFIAMKQCCEYVRGLRYKLRMMGIPVEDPAFIYGDNKSVLSNTTIPDSVLSKKSNSIAYHFVREGASMDEWRTGYINTKENPADILSKAVPAGKDRDHKVGLIMWDI